MKYGYRMCNCTIEQFQEYTKHCYQWKQTPEPLREFGTVQFDSIEQAVDKVCHVLIPKEHATLGNAKWSLEQDNTLLVKSLSFESNGDAVMYQEAVERAWALGGHLDPRVEQSYHE